MILRDITLPTPVQNILLDDVLLHLAEHSDSGEMLRFWESPTPFIVLGRTGKMDQDVYIEKALADRVSILRRSSGGGTVVQGPGCLNFTLILAKSRHPHLLDLGKSYRFILEKVIAVLAAFEIPAVFRPISDLAVGGTEKKFSGNAQKRGRSFILHHGTLLYQFDLPVIEKYLRIPLDVPEYRQGRGHLDFVTNISLSIPDLKAAFGKVWEIKKENNSLSGPESLWLEEFLNTRDFSS